MGIGEIETENRKLPIGDRAALAKWIVESLDELSEAEIERWRMAMFTIWQAQIKQSSSALLFLVINFG